MDNQTAENFNPNKTIAVYYDYETEKFCQETLDNLENPEKYSDDKLKKIFKNKDILIESHRFGNSISTRLEANTSNLSKNSVTFLPITYGLKDANKEKANKVFIRLAGNGGVFQRAEVNRNTGITLSGNSIGNYLVVELTEKLSDNGYSNLRLIVNQPAYSVFGVDQGTELNMQHFKNNPNVKTLIVQNNEFDPSGFGLTNFHTEETFAGMLKNDYQIPQDQIDSLDSATGAILVIKDETFGISEPRLFIRGANNPNGILNYTYGRINQNSNFVFQQGDSTYKAAGSVYSKTINYIDRDSPIKSKTETFVKKTNKIKYSEFNFEDEHKLTANFDTEEKVESICFVKNGQIEELPIHNSETTIGEDFIKASLKTEDSRIIKFLLEENCDNKINTSELIKSFDKVHTIVISSENITNENKGFFTLGDNCLFNGVVNSSRRPHSGNLITKINDSEYKIIEYENGIKLGSPTQIYLNNNVFTRTAAENIAAIQNGEVIYNNGYIYGIVDGFQTAEPIGRIYTTGRFYGTFYEDGRSREGKMTFLNGNIFNGTFSEDGTLQEGTITLTNGNIIEGTFSEDETPQHKVTITLTNGNILKGTFSEDVAIIEYENGIKLEVPTQIYLNNNVFTRTAAENIAVIQNGEVIYNNGYIYGIVDGLQTAEPIGYIYSNDRRFYGTFNENGVLKEGTITLTNSDIFEGTFNENGILQEGIIQRKIGNNKYKISDIKKGSETEIASVEYKNASKNTGTMVFRNDNIFYGTFYGNGMPQEGIMILANGNIYRGTFNKDGRWQDGYIMHDTNGNKLNPFKYEVKNGKKSRKAEQLPLYAMIDVERELDNNILQTQAEVGMN